MKHRAIKDLAQLKEEELYNAVSEGLFLCFENANELWENAESLFESRKFRGSRVLAAFACEEASKCLILLDSLRCPRDKQKEFAVQLQRFNDHLSKGVYKKICDWSPDTYGRLCEYIDSELDQYYLDGPNDVDWIFRNAIISSREESIYVDYVEFEPGEHFWLSPQSKDIGDDLFQSSFVPGVIRMIRLLNSTGLFKPKALKEFSKFWQEFRFTEETHHIAFRDANFDFLKILDDKGLLSKMGEDDVARFIDRYPYPLYGKDIKENRVDKEELMDARRRYIENELS